MWYPWLRAGVYAANSISNSWARRSARKTAERLASLEREFDQVVSRRGLDISEFEFSNVLAFYLQKHELIPALKQYLVLLQRGGRFPADEETCWRHGYNMRQKSGHLTDEDKQRMSVLKKKRRQQSRIENRKTINGSMFATAILLIVTFCAYFLASRDAFVVAACAALCCACGTLWLISGRG